VTLRRLTRERYPFSPVDRVARKNSWRTHFRMTAVALSPEPQRAGSGADRAPLLRWLIFTGATVFAAILLWRYGLFRLMVVSDRTYLSSVIVLIYVGASLHCLWRTIVISREGDAGQRVAGRIETGGPDVAALEPSAALPDGLIAGHIRDLAMKARTQGRGRLDQTLLLRSLADRLRGSNGFGAFASDTVIKLGLLGTIIGFIIMLAPIAGLDASDKAMMKSSMGLMSDGMAVAMYTTLAGLVGSILLRIQYYMLDNATAKVFSRAVTLTETRVVPALERAHELAMRA
jgi:MotA/TolQ/ExbB proton channel family